MWFLQFFATNGAKWNLQFRVGRHRIEADWTYSSLLREQNYAFRSFSIWRFLHPSYTFNELNSKQIPILTILIHFNWQNEWFAEHLVITFPSSWWFNWIVRMKCMPIIDCFSLGVLKMTECTHTAHTWIPHINVDGGSIQWTSKSSYFLFRQICLFLACIWLVSVRGASLRTYISTQAV